MQLLLSDTVPSAYFKAQHKVHTCMYSKACLVFLSAKVVPNSSRLCSQCTMACLHSIHGLVALTEYVMPSLQALCKCTKGMHEEHCNFDIHKHGKPVLKLCAFHITLRSPYLIVHEGQLSLPHSTLCMIAVKQLS